MEFKKGVRVFCTEAPDGKLELVGKTGVIYEEVDDGGWVTVYWDDFNNGWGADEACWSCPPETIIIADMENV